MEAFECNGSWWLPGSEKHGVAGTLNVSEGGSMKLSLVGPLGEAKNVFAEKSHPIILGSVDKGPKGNEVTLTDSFRTGATFGSFKDVRESYHVGRGYFGALLPDDSCFAFRSMRLRLGGMTEWMYSLSGFERRGPGLGSAGETVPLGFYTRREPVRVPVPGGSIIVGLGLRASYSGTRCDFQEEAQVKVTCETPLSDAEFNDRYGYALRNLMTFVCDRAQTIEQFSVWRPDAPDQEILVVGELIQPDRADAKEEVSWHEMLFTFKEVEFDDFIKRWFELTRVYRDACNVYFGLMYGPPSFLEMKFQNVANAVHLYYDRHADGAARREDDELHMKEILESLTAPGREWVVDHIGANPRAPFRAALNALLEKHGSSIDPLIGGRRDRFVDTILGTLEYWVRRDPDLEAAAASGADLYWLTEKLRFLLKACFVHESGFSEDAVLRCFRRNPLYQHIHHLESAREAVVGPGLPEPDQRAVSEPAEEPTLRSSEFQAFWKFLEKESPRGRTVGIAAYFDESLGRLLGDRGEAFQSKLRTAHRKGLLTNNEYDDLQEIRRLRNLVVHQVGGPQLSDEEKLIVERLKTWRIAADAVPRYEQLIPAPEDRLLYVGAVIAARLERRGSGGGAHPLPEPEVTDVQSWPPLTDP
jgi:hypothetical protein